MISEYNTVTIVNILKDYIYDKIIITRQQYMDFAKKEKEFLQKSIIAEIIKRISL